MTLTFEQKLKNYAEVMVRIGVNVQPGQRLLITAHRDAEILVYEVARAAYRAGATFVDVVWQDDIMSLIQLTEGPEGDDNVWPFWMLDVAKAYIENGDAVVSVRTTIPGIFDDVPVERMRAYQRARGQYSNDFMQLMNMHESNVSITNVPTREWALKVFPELSPDEALNQLWEAVFKTVRADRKNPIAAWDAHIASIMARSNHLTAKQYTALKYTGSGTELTIGLPDNHIWLGGGSVSKRGVRSTFNIPTEEVFTLPHREKVSGVVRSTMPLDARGVMIDDFSLTFSEGRVVDFDAASGADHLRNLIQTDEGASRLGEVALVSHSSPISQLGITFYHTLYDENASCHIALGSAYRQSLEDGARMDDETFNAHGGNTSLIHTDFMIGSSELDIDGVTKDGRHEPIMRQGEWAFEV